MILKRLSTLLGVFIGFILAALAQEPPAPYPNQTERYCKVIVTWTPGNGSGNRVCGAMLDYGNPAPRMRSQRQSLILRDDKKQPMRFNSPVDILNYMNSLGWTLVHAFEHGEEDIRYLMKQPL
ncbi:MAG: hypothetical protein AB8F95_08170 [Bacteroidia bacterium]